MLELAIVFIGLGIGMLTGGVVTSVIEEDSSYVIAGLAALVILLVMSLITFMI